MRPNFRRALVFIGSVVLGFAVGGGLDRVVTPVSSADNLVGPGLQAGVALGLILVGFVRDRSEQDQ